MHTAAKILIGTTPSKCVLELSYMSKFCHTVKLMATMALINVPEMDAAQALLDLHCDFRVDNRQGIRDEYSMHERFIYVFM